MKKAINNHIKNQDFVKAYLVDEEGSKITHIEGIIFEQTDKLILMNDMTDFNYDGLVIIRKKDLSEIKHTDNERFFKKILDKENITQKIASNKEQANVILSKYKELLVQVMVTKQPVIIECKYANDDRFLVGPITKVADKYIEVKYFNSQGQYDLKEVKVKIKDITVLKIDSPYANTFYKYAYEIE